MRCTVLIQHHVRAARHITRRRALGLEEMHYGESAPKRLRDAVPLRGRKPDPEFPLDVMVVSLCPKVGDGVLRLRWRTKKRIELEREWLVNRGLPGEVVVLKFGVVRDIAYPPGEMEIQVLPDVKRLRSSPYEVRPLCPHYDHCGGCHFLNLRYGRQLIEKQRWVEHAVVKSYNSLDVLRRIRPSQPQTRFAHSVEWVFSERYGELRFGPAGSAPLGLEAEPPAGCILPPRTSVRALTTLFEVFRRCHLEDPWTYNIYEEIRGHGLFKSVVAICTRPPEGTNGLRQGPRTELLINIVLADTVQDVAGVMRPIVEALSELVPQRLVGIVANVARSKAAVMGGRMEFLLHGRRYARQKLDVQIGGQPRQFVLELGAGSRLLSHTRMLPDVAQQVLEMCEIQSSDTVWHCFAGAGELTLGLAAVSEHVVAVATSPAEVSELKRNLAANSVGNTTAVLANLRSPWTLKHLSFHISQSQQRRLLLGTGEEQAKARDYAIAAFVPGESRRRQLQRLSAGPFNAPLLREDALAHRELRTLLPAFVRDFRPSMTTLPALRNTGDDDAADSKGREVPPEMESRLKRMYRRLALKYHPDRNPDDPEASHRFQALTRAYRALVGDTAGPEEGDEDAEDPFLVAMASNYRPKFKHRWRDDGKSAQRSSLAGERHTTVHSSDAQEDEDAMDMDEAEEDSEEDEDFAVKLEIDESWARGSTSDAHLVKDPVGTMGEHASTKELVFNDDGMSDLIADGSAVPIPTLAPPDVIVVSQPRDRKAGRGTPKHFTDWLRSTAVRSIVYVSRDTDAFKEDVLRLRELGYRLKQVQPFDVEPHRRSILLIAKLELVRPLEGAADYGPDGDKLIAPSPAMLPGDERPLLGSGGYTAMSTPVQLGRGSSREQSPGP